MATPREDVQNQYDKYIQQSTLEDNGAISAPETPPKEDPYLKYGAIDTRKTPSLDIDIEDYSDYIGEVFDPSTDINQRRAQAQSNWEQTGNALGRVLLNVVPTVVGNLASIADVEDYYNQDQEVGNAITNAMEEFKQKVNQDYFPIYRENPGEHLDIGDFAWWAENGSALTESIAAFAATGALTGGLLAGLSRTGKVGKAAATLINATGLNQAEAITTATQVYNSTYQKELSKLKAAQQEAMSKEGSLILSDEDIESQARQLASDAAAYSVNLNRMNIALNITSAGAFLRSPKVARNILKAPSTKGKLVSEGSQEFVEEEINLIAQKEGERYGSDPKGYQYSLERSLDDVLSAEGIETGILGAIGGIGQTGGTHVANNITGKNKDELSRYNTQQARIDLINKTVAPESGQSLSTVFKDLSQQKEIQDEFNAAVESGDTQKAQELGEQLLGESIGRSLRDGTTEVLEDSYSRIAEMKEEDAASKGYDTNPNSDYYYKTKANEAIETIRRAEKVYNDYDIRNKYNSNNIFRNRYRNLMIQDALERNSQKISDQESVFDSEFSSLIKDVESSILEDRAVKDASKDITDEDIDRLVQGSQLTKDDVKNVVKKGIEIRKNLPSYKLLNNLKQDRDQLQKILQENNNEYNTLTTDEAQEKASIAEEKESNEIENKLKESAKEEVRRAENQQDILKVKNETANNPAVSDAVNNEISSIAEDQQEQSEPIKGENISRNDIRERYKNKPALFEKESGEIINKVINEHSDPEAANSILEFIGDIDGFEDLVNDVLNTDRSTLSPVMAEFADIITDYYNNVSDMVENVAETKAPVDKAQEIEHYTKGQQENVDVILEEKKGNNDRSGFQTFDTRYVYNNKEEKFERDTNGNLIQTDINIGDVDFQYIDNPDTLPAGTELSYEVDLDTVNSDKDSYHTDLRREGGDALSNRGQVLIVNYDENNVRRVVGKLNPYKPNDTDSEAMKSLRDEIFKNIIPNSDQTTGILRTNIKTKIEDKYNGRFHNTSATNRPSDVLRPGDPLVFAVGTSTSEGAISLNTSNAPGEYQYVFSQNVKPGAVYMLVKSSNGTVVPYRVFTSRLNELAPEVANKYRQQIRQILEDTTIDNWKEKRDELSDIIYLNYGYGKGGFVIDKQNQSLADMIDLAENSVMQVSTRRINGADNYNQMLSDDGIVTTDVAPQSYTHSSRFMLQPYDGIFSLSKNVSDKVAEAVTEKSAAQTEEALTDLPDGFTADNVDEAPILDFGSLLSKEGNTEEDKTKEANLKFDVGISKRRRGNRANLNKLNPNFRLEDDGVAYKKWDKNEELSWMRKNLPNVPVEVISNIKEVYNNGGKDAWGMFYNSTVYLNENAAVGTTYHEAFHAVFRLFLNDSERASVMRDAKKKYGDLSELALEEKMAEEFREYIETEEATAKSLPSKIRAFFKKLYSLMKNLFTTNVNMDTLFNRINTGFYADKKVLNRDASKFSEPAFRIKEYSPKEQKQRVESVTREFFEVIEDIREDNDEYADLSDVDIIKAVGINGIYARVYNNFIDIREDYKDINAPKEVIDSYNILLNNLIIGKSEEGNPIFGELALLSMRGLSQYDIKVDFNANQIREMFDSANEGKIFELNEEDTTAEGWQTNYIEQSGKEKLSREIKKLFRQVPVIKDGQELTDDIGMVVHEDPNQLFSFAQRNLSNIKDTNEFYDTFEVLTKIKPSLENLYNNVLADEKLKTQFKVGLTNNHTTFLSVIPTKSYDNISREVRFQGKYSTISSNRRGIVNNIISDFREDMIRSGITSIEGTVNTSKAATVSSNFNNVLKALNVKKTFNKDDYSKISKALNSIGIKVTADNINDWTKSFTNDTVSAGEVKVLINNDTNKIFKALEKGKDVFDTEGSSIKKLAQIIAKSEIELLEDSFRNTENKTVYSHLVNNFMGDHINEFRSEYDVDGKPRWRQKLDFYLEDKYYKTSPWLKALEDKTTRDNFEFGVVDGTRSDGEDKGTKYSDMSPKQLTSTVINMWHNNGSSYGWNRVPTLSDAPNMPMVKFKKYNNKEVIDQLYQVALQENARIQQVKEDMKTYDKNEIIKNYHSEVGLQYQFFPFLNKYKGRNLASIDPSNIKSEISDWVESSYDKDISRLIDSGVISDVRMTDDNQLRDFKTDALSSDVSSDILKNWFYNSILANTQVISLTSGDPAFYKANNARGGDYYTGVDFQKRNKQIWSPSTRLDTNNKNVRKQYKSVYINDNEIRSASYDDIVSAINLDDTVPQSIKNKIAKAYSEGINEADAQAYVTLDRFKEIMHGLGRWTPQHEDTFTKLKAGEGTGANWKLFQPLKPFYFGHSKINGRVVPTQNKNSEYILMPSWCYKTKDDKFKLPTEADRANGYSTYKSAKMAKMLDFMQRDSYNDENTVDSVQFESTVKVGLHGKTDFENIGDAKVHYLDNDSFGLQQETPEHHIDSKNLYGSQIRKLIFSDLPDTFEVTIGDNKFTKKELFDKYHDIIDIDLKSAYDNVLKSFSNIEEIQNLLLEEAVNRNMGEDFFDAIQLVPDGKGGKRFNLPLFHPKISKQAESLINSIFKNRITKQKIQGGAMIQVSGFGFTDELKVKVNPKTGNLEYMEVYAPAYSEKFFKPFMDENGNIDMKAIEEKAPELLEAVGYRIPTEDFYSMAAIKIKGFTPREAGGGIVLPADITTIAGSDFDVDKMFMMFYEFETLKDGSVRKIDYDWTKSPSQQSQASRNNGKIDIIRSILTHPSSFKKFINPGGFDTVESLVGEINELTGKTKELLPLSLPSTFDTFSERNNAGKALVGVFANHNASHAVFQHTNIAFADPILFDNKVGIGGFDGKMLNRVDDIEGNLVSKNVAEFLAAIVDNAKVPTSAFLNINPYTADVLASILRVGYPIKTAVYFLNQPIVRELSKRYLNEGANFSAENKILDEFKEQFNRSIENKEDVLKKELTTSNMKKSIGSENLFSEDQFLALERFLEIKNQGQSLAKAVRAMRADTKAAGPTMADNEVFIRDVDDALLDDNISGLKEVFTGDEYKMNRSFYKYGIKDPNDNILKKNFPWMSKAFMGAKDMISEKLKTGDLTTDDINMINSSIMSYASTGYKFFDTDQRSDIVNDLPNRFVSIVEKYPELKDVKIIRLLQRKSAGIDNIPIDRLEFQNTGSMNNIQKDEVSQSLEYLLEHSNEEFRVLGEDLIKYSFLTAGFGFTPFSFSHVIPTSFYSNLKVDNGDDATIDSFSDYLSKMSESSSDSDDLFNNFLDQFYRNNYENNKFVPKIDKENNNITAMYNDKAGNPNTVIIDSSKLKDDSFILDGDDSQIDDVVPYIKKVLNGKTYIFRVSDIKGNRATYTRVDALGVPNRVVEYNYNGADVDSVFTFNKVKGSTSTQSFEATEAIVNDVVDPSTLNTELDIPSQAYNNVQDEYGDVPVASNNIDDFMNITISRPDFSKKEVDKIKEGCNG